MKNVSRGAGGGRIHYLDTNAAFAGHRVCSGVPYLNGIVTEETSNSGTSHPGMDSFHPNVYGQQALATVVNNHLAGNENMQDMVICLPMRLRSR